jgi:hypothetical protein
MTPPATGRSLVKAITLAIAVCGTLDIADALIFYWFRSATTPMRLLQNIASVPLGPQAFKGGWPMAGVGLLIHYCIATVWVCLFVLLAQRIAWMFRSAVAAGLLYGLVIYICMNFVVLPLFHRIVAVHVNAVFINAVLALVLCIGLPLALINRSYAPLPLGK